MVINRPKMNSEIIRLVQFTNIPSHHQIPLGNAFAKKLNNSFMQVCMEQGHQERRKLGWEEDFNKDWLVKAWSSEKERTRAIELFRSAEIAIWGYDLKNEIDDRIVKGKLTFHYSERLFKSGKWRLLDPRVLKSLIVMFGGNNRRNHHLLAVGPYCAEDFKLLGLFKGRMWRWGYFPELTSLKDYRDPASPPIILWAGRMLPYKRVDLFLRAAAWARTKGAGEFRIHIIGKGTEEEQLRSLTINLGLADICQFYGPQSPGEVGKAMERASIYVFPSNQQEGWGVVVNEAMSRGCCVIGSKSTGSVPWLIQDGVNGYVFDGENVEYLGRKLLWCIDHPEQRQEMGLTARITIKKLWSPEVAAERFLSLCEMIKSGKPSPYQDGGPCSTL